MALESLNTAQFNHFVDFATQKLEAGETKAIARISTEDPLGNRTIKACDRNLDSVGKIRRNEIEQMRNDNARTIFKDAVSAMFGGEDRIPANVKKAMVMDDYGWGKPLTARRIMAVKAEVDKYAESFNQAIVSADQKVAEAYPNLSAEQRHAMVNAAIRLAAGDKMALEIVSKCITSIVRNGASQFRSIGDIEKKVNDILGNVAEIRASAKGNQAVLDAGKGLLIDMKGKKIAAGVIPRLVDFALKMDTSAVRKLGPNSSALQIHKAVHQFTDNLNDGINKTGAKEAFIGGDERDSVRNFIAMLHFAKCSASTVAKIRQSMASETASKLSLFYFNASNGDYKLGNNVSANLKDCVQGDAAPAARTMLNRLNVAIQIKCGVPDSEIKPTQMFDGEIRSHDVNGDAILADLVKMGRAMMESVRKEFLEKCVTGNGPGADIVRNTYSKRIGAEPYKPEEEINYAMVNNNRTMLGLNIMGDCKKLALGDIKNTMFFKDVNRLEDVTVGGQKLSKDFETARNQIAAFVTKNAKTTYAALDPKEKTKAHIVMSLISQETGKAAQMGDKIALDKDGSVTAIDTVYNGGNATDIKFEFTLSNDGGLQMELTGTDKFVMIMGYGEDGDMVSANVGKGSRFEYSISLRLKPNEFNRLAELDFTKYDSTGSQQILEGESKNKFDTIYSKLPEEYRLSEFGTAIHANAHFTIM